MQANTLTPQKLFEHQVRYVIPVFQRPYVWKVEKQWGPLSDDVRAVVEELLEAKAVSSSWPVPPHFLGAVVLDQQLGPSGYIAVRHVIDGQQRLITLQLLLNAVRQVVAEHGKARDAGLLDQLVRNPKNVVDHDDELLKVWPIAHDRDAFKRAMDDDHGNDQGEHLINQAIVFLRARITSWATEPDGAHTPEERLGALTMALAQHLKLVVIDLEAGDNAQAIFESLNDRGSRLLAADLVKNAVFQAAEKQGLDVEALDQQYWSAVDGAYWRKELRQGRLNRPRIDVFLNYWLTMRRAHVVPSDRIFTEFREHVLEDVPDVRPVLQELRDDSSCYRELASQPPFSVPGTFYYRVIEVMDIAATMPLLLWLMRPVSEVPNTARDQALRALESWIIRRALCRITLADTNSLMAELLQQLRKVDAGEAGVVTQRFLAGQEGDSRRWPTDDEVIDSLRSMQLYRVFRPRRRARMLLEALEDDLRSPMSEDAHCQRGVLTIEHVMPQSWRTYWATDRDDDDVASGRDALVQTLGNLTLLTGKLNPHVSNYPWLATTADDRPIRGKRDALNEHSVLRLNNRLLAEHHDDWTDNDIRRRTEQLAKRIVQIWRRADVPGSH